MTAVSLKLAHARSGGKRFGKAGWNSGLGAWDQAEERDALLAFLTS